jgi:osmotically-inducible protein OsmY
MIGCAMRRVMLAGAFLLGAPVMSFAGATPPCTQHAAQVATVDDRRTTDEVERRIAADETTAPLADHVKVTTAQGVVTLRGIVEHAEDRLVLASVAEGTPGVRRVEDQLELRER